MELYEDWKLSRESVKEQQMVQQKDQKRQVKRYQRHIAHRQSLGSDPSDRRQSMGADSVDRRYSLNTER